MIIVGVVLSIIAGQANYRAVYGSIQNNFINQFEDKNVGMKFTYFEERLLSGQLGY
jgi:hypothetical protein